MPILTLTTDFGTKDHFVGAVKGAIHSTITDARIVDISHQISPFNITETAYILKNAYKNFPEGTIHIVGVDSELHEDNKHISNHLEAARNNYVQAVVLMLFGVHNIQARSCILLSVQRGPGLVYELSGRRQYFWRLCGCCLVWMTMGFINENMVCSQIPFQNWYPQRGRG